MNALILVNIAAAAINDVDQLDTVGKSTTRNR
jgi:hypothetical protein